MGEILSCRLSIIGRPILILSAIKTYELRPSRRTDEVSSCELSIIERPLRVLAVVKTCKLRTLAAGWVKFHRAD